MLHLTTLPPTLHQMLRFGGAFRLCQEHADDLFLQCNGKRFNSFEEARCRVVFVATVSFDLRATAALPTPGSPSITGAGGGSCGNNGGVATVTAPDFTPSPRAADATIAISADKNRGPSEVSMSSMHTDVRFAPFMPPAYTGGGNMVSAGIVGSSNSATATEAHDASTCVICMDRMESHVLMTVCNHSFHVECLVKWQDSPCPVCRFHHNNASEASTCQVRLEATVLRGNTFSQRISSFSPLKPRHCVEPTFRVPRPVGCSVSC